MTHASHHTISSAKSKSRHQRTASCINYDNSSVTTAKRNGLKAYLWWRPVSTRKKSLVSVLRYISIYFSAANPLLTSYTKTLNELNWKSI
ncbi:hypothetical protein Hanom_Chr06g00488971 [Helianthus anomalus]